MLLRSNANITTFKAASDCLGIASKKKKTKRKRTQSVVRLKKNDEPNTITTPFNYLRDEIQ